MENKKIQIRSTGAVESGDNRNISGYAIVFNSRSEKLYDIWSGKYFYETIIPDACTQEFIDSQDIRFLRNHNEMGISLARSKRGEGSLHLEVDETGVRFSFSCPETPAGDELLDAIRRGDVDRMSFAFCTSNDNITETKNDDGTFEHTINKIDMITEISALDVSAAYSETSVDNRQKNTDNNMTKEELDALKEELKEQILNELKENEPESAPAEDEREDPEDEAPAEEKAPEKEEPVENPEEPTESEEEVDDNEENNEENKRSINTMNKKQFSLLKAIRSVVNTGKLDATSKAVSDLGAQELRASGLACSGQIQLPVEKRDAVTVSAEGEDVVVTDFTDILEPLRANNVLADSGARIMTGLVGDLQVPTMNAQNVGWAGEIAMAQESGAGFDHVLLQPKRLTAYVDVSKQFLVQDSLGAEELIRRDLINAIQTKLESTILSADAGDATKPAGIFNGATAVSVADFESLVELESNLEDANFNGEYVYVLSPKAKAAFRSMIKGTNGTGMVMENGEVDGTPALVTTNMATKKFAVGDFSNLIVGQWGAIDLTVDPFSQAANGVVRIVINAFFDAKMAREGAIVYGEVE